MSIITAKGFFVTLLQYKFDSIKISFMNRYYQAKSKILFRKCFVVLALITTASTPFAQTPAPNYPVKRTESSETWLRDGRAAIKRAKALKPNKRKAKNVILFIGDGMGVTTLTAARILEGQMRGESGEENRLSFENFPYSALSKTYSVNQQTSDSAPTMTAIITGVKTDEGILSVNQNVVRGDYRTVKGNEVKSLLEMAEENNKSTGVVSTARLTHATPAACYAHSPDRDWESDKEHSRPFKRRGKRKISRHRPTTHRI